MEKPSIDASKAIFEVHCLLCGKKLHEKTLAQFKEGAFTQICPECFELSKGRTLYSGDCGHEGWIEDNTLKTMYGEE